MYPPAATALSASRSRIADVLIGVHFVKRRSAASSVRSSSPSTVAARAFLAAVSMRAIARSEEHTSELQSLRHLVCRLLLEKKNKEDMKQIGIETHEASETIE